MVQYWYCNPHSVYLPCQITSWNPPKWTKLQKYAQIHTIKCLDIIALWTLTAESKTKQICAKPYFIKQLQAYFIVCPTKSLSWILFIWLFSYDITSGYARTPNNFWGQLLAAWSGIYLFTDQMHFPSTRHEHSTNQYQSLIWKIFQPRTNRSPNNSIKTLQEATFDDIFTYDLLECTGLSSLCKQCTTNTSRWLQWQ